MHIRHAVYYILASLSLVNAATLQGGLTKRQVVNTNICATVGPLQIANVLAILPPIVIASKICLCTQGGVLTPQSVADVTSALTVAQNGGLLDGLLGVVGTTVTTLLNGLLSSATTQVNKSGGQCTTAIPANGYPTCPSATSAAGQCTFACNTDFKVCGTTCIATAQTCPTGVLRRSQERAVRCPTGWDACPIQLAKSIIYECMNTSSDLESCGGCPGLANEGIDCSGLPGVGDVACVDGKCRVRSCMRGYVRDVLGGCVKK